VAAPRRPGRTLVVGVGERFRQDDGAGPQVVRLLRGRLPPEVELVERVSEMTELIDLWDGAGLAVVVDAMRSGAAAGSLRRLEAPELGVVRPERATSSHGLSVVDAYELGAALGRRPERLVVFLIEAGPTGAGDALSRPVADAVGRAAAAIEAELQAPPRPG